MAAHPIRADWFKAAAGWATSAKPSIQGFRVTGSSLVITFDENLTANSPTASQFTVTVNGSGNVVTAASAAKNGKVTLTLTTPVTTGQTVLVSYTGAGAIKVLDAAGNQAAPFTTQPVVNLT